MGIDLLEFNISILLIYILFSNLILAGIELTEMGIWNGFSKWAKKYKN